MKCFLMYELIAQMVKSKWLFAGGNFPEGRCPKGVIFFGPVFARGSIPKGNFPGGIFPWGNVLHFRLQIFGRQSVCVAVFR